MPLTDAEQPLAVSKNPRARTSAIRHTADAAFAHVINADMSTGFAHAG
jgi:hypothetical protein